MQCLVLAGGLGTRMRPLTETIPKALIPVAGRPFADYQLEWLASEGVTDVVFSVGYLGDHIERHVGDGHRFGLRVRYVDEGPTLRGTAGAIRLAVEAGALEDHFFVLYGDAYLRVDLRAVHRRFQASGLPVLMTVFRNDGRWADSNVIYEDDRVLLYDKFAADRRGMHHVDYGVLMMSRSVIEDAMPPGGTGDLATILGDLSRLGLVGGFEATERFYEIGSPEGVEDLERHLTGRRAGSAAGVAATAAPVSSPLGEPPPPAR